MKKSVRFSMFILFSIMISIALLATACGSAEKSGADPTALPYTPMAYEGGSGGSEPIVGRPEEGQKVFEEHCSICHAIEKGELIEGPSLYAAGTRLTYDYVKESIRLPWEHMASFEEGEDFTETTMPTDFEQKLSTQDFEDLIAYILSLNE